MSFNDIDIEKPDDAIRWLREVGQIGDDEVPELKKLTGGVSNRTVMVRRLRTQTDTWVIKQALEKLRVEVDWFSSPDRVHREAAGLRWLERLLPHGAVPKFVCEDHRHHVLMMQAVGQPHENWKTMLLSGDIVPDHCQQFGRLLGTIHRQAFVRRDEVQPEFGDRSFFESLRLEPYFAYAASQVTAAAAFYEQLLADTRRRCLTLVHGDYSPKNVLVHGGQLVLLDHEVIHWGDPAFDVGFGLTHFLSKAHHLPHCRDRFSAAAHSIWAVYLEAIDDVPWRHDLPQHAVNQTLGCLLARVAGRSPLEYLSKAERAQQQQAVLTLIANRPADIPDLIESFVRLVGA